LDLLDLNYRYHPGVPVGSQIWSPWVLIPISCLSTILTEIQESTSISMPTLEARMGGTTLDMDAVRTV
jgi:hypothetical protein